MKILKKLSVFDIIIGILFIVITFLSIMLFKWLGLLAIPILILMIYIYYNSDKIAILIRNLIKNISKKSSDEEIEINNNKRKNIDNKNNKKKKYSIDDEFEDNDIIIDEKKEILYEKKEKDIVKKVSKNNSNNKIKNKSKNKSVKNNKEKKKKRNILKVILTIFLSFCIIGVLAVAAFFAYIVVTTEDFDPNKLTYRDQSVVYDKNGNTIAELGVGGSEKRESVSYDDLPQVLIDAIIATEDSRFFNIMAWMLQDF